MNNLNHLPSQSQQFRKRLLIVASSSLSHHCLYYIILELGLSSQYSQDSCCNCSQFLSSLVVGKLVNLKMGGLVAAWLRLCLLRGKQNQNVCHFYCHSVPSQQYIQNSSCRMINTINITIQINKPHPTCAYYSYWYIYIKFSNWPDANCRSRCPFSVPRNT